MHCQILIFPFKEYYCVHQPFFFSRVFEVRICYSFFSAQSNIFNSICYGFFSAQSNIFNSHVHTCLIPFSSNQFPVTTDNVKSTHFLNKGVVSVTFCYHFFCLNHGGKPLPNGAKCPG